VGRWPMTTQHENWQTFIRIFFAEFWSPLLGVFYLIALWAGIYY
jgi:hypothetical protein